jgi:tetratricopeptide (TPR) repeat protein
VTEATAGSDPVFEALLSKAADLESAQDNHAAGATLLEAAALRPESFTPWLRLVFVRMDADDDDGAIAAARAALQRVPDNPLAHTILGIALNFAHDHDDAAEAFARALELDPEIQMATVELAKLRVGTDDDEALRLFRRARELGELYPDDAVRFADLLTDLAEFDDAERLLREALGSHPDNGFVRRTLVRLLFEQGRVDDAEELLKAAADASGDWQDWTFYVYFALFICDDPEHAATVARAAIDRGIRHESLYGYLARAAWLIEEPAEAIRAIETEMTASLEPAAGVFLEQGKIAEMIDEDDRAEQAYRNATAIDGAGSAPWVSLGHLLARKPLRRREAEQALRHAVALEGDDPHCGALKDLAELHVHRGDDVEATLLLERAIGLNERCECSLVLRGQVAFRKGDKALARQLYERVLTLNPGNISALTSLARLGRGSEAEEIVERAMLFAPEDARVLMARSQLRNNPIAERISDAEAALERDADLAEVRLVLAGLFAAHGDAERAIVHFREALLAVPSQMELIPAFVNTALDLVRAGLLEEVSKLLEGSEGKMVEPLAVALRLYRGEKVIVAKEIAEVAGDILAQLKPVA